MIITNKIYLDGYYQNINLDGYNLHEIPGFVIIPTCNTWIVITNMRYLNVNQHEIPGCLLPT